MNFICITWKKNKTDVGKWASYSEQSVRRTGEKHEKRNRSERNIGRQALYRK